MRIIPKTKRTRAFSAFLPLLRGASANRAPSTKRVEAALPSDAATDPDFGGPGGMALWRPTESPAFASAYAHRGEHVSSHPCRTAESPLGRTSARPGGFVPRICAPRIAPASRLAFGSGDSKGARRGGVAREHFRGSDGFLTPVRTGERYARASKICRGRPRNAGRVSIAAQRP